MTIQPLGLIGFTGDTGYLLVVNSSAGSLAQLLNQSTFT